MATKMVKNEQRTTETKKSTFATVQTAKQQLTKKTYHFFFISTQQTIVSRNCKNSPKFSESNSEEKNRLTEGDGRKIQPILRLVIGYTTGMEERTLGRDHLEPEVVSIAVYQKRTVGRRGGGTTAATNKKKIRGARKIETARIVKQ